MKLSHLLTGLLAGPLVCFIGGAEASPQFQAPMVSPLTMQAGLKCGLVNGQLVCGDKMKSSKHNDDDDDDQGKDNDDDDQKPKGKKAAKNCKKARCESGLVVLDKPNKYGACCEAREGLPPPKTAEPEKCQFPGEVGTPPNCKCPEGTEFMGYKGCVKKVVQTVCCTGVYPNGVQSGRDCGAPEAAVRKITSSGQLNGVPIVESSITCAPEK